MLRSAFAAARRAAARKNAWAAAEGGCCSGGGGGGGGGASGGAWTAGAAHARGWWQLRPARRMWEDRRGYEHFDGRGPMMFGRGRAAFWVAGLGLAGGTYYVSCLQEVPYTHRRHAIMFVSQQSELALGKQVFEQTKREAIESGTLLPPHHPYTRLVERVGHKIAQVACSGHGGGFQDHMKGIKWEFAVINSPQVNAFVAPGGKVVVFTGLLGIVGHEDELAAVLAHEAAHVLARHSAENMSRASALGLASIFINWVLGVPLPPDLLVLGFFLPHSRAAESEADAIGIRLLAQACYDPEANVRMLQRLSSQEKKSGGALEAAVPAILRTHPLTQDRVARVRALLPEAYKEYQASCSPVAGAWHDFVRVLG